ncbi:MAG: RluA family pseudouridine synthase [Neisseriaceae bacterium]|nr:RluA family pseudouridine synthase [Neisseriaceae bacterium]
MKSTSLNNADDYNDDFEFSADLNEQICKFVVPNELGGMRLDAALAKLMPEYSRSRLTTWIKEGAVLVGGKVAAPKLKLIGQEALEVTILPSEENLAFTPEDIEIPVVFEDDTVLVVNKPAGLVVHPASGNWTGTLLNGLLHHYPDQSQIPRAGIVHRLDKDTSGLMVVAKNLPAQNDLVQQLQARTVKRVYRAIADGLVPFDGKIETKIGRDPHNRLKMAVVKYGGKEAITHIKVLERYLNHTYVECTLETGRTHQIRVHMREARHPLSGDPVYGTPRHNCSDAAKEAVKGLARQALHAYKLSFVHPKTKELVSFEAPMAPDMHHVLSVLRLESGKDSPLSSEPEWAEVAMGDDDDDWDEDDYDVEVRYVRD